MSQADFASLSNLLMDVAIVGYSVAMLLYAMEMLTAKVRPARERAQAKQPELVGATVGGSSGAAGDADAPEPDDDATAVPHPGARSVFLGRAAVAITVLAWLCHLVQIVSRGVAADRWPWGNMYEFTSTICFTAVTAFLALLVKRNVRFLGLYLLALVVLGLGLNGALLYKSAGPLVPALHSYWIAIHVTAAILAIGLFAVSAVVSALYLFADRHQAKVAKGADTSSAGLLRRVPAPEALDKLSYRVIAVAFPIWTFALVAGAIWAEAAWGRYWGWDPKETWTFIIWVIYAGYLHARVTAGWRGRRAAIIALAAFAAILVNYFVVNIWIVGLHSYA
ncbi:MAG: c-type cytochrome biogenesis protein CcsB [Streptosporangiales bacterium]|nr:c-type cytochrome biogenesis protein CcsB [Streptosporangiales bacterium]